MTDEDQIALLIIFWFPWVVILLGAIMVGFLEELAQLIRRTGKYDQRSL